MASLLSSSLILSLTRLSSNGKIISSSGSYPDEIYLPFFIGVCLFAVVTAAGAVVSGGGVVTVVVEIIAVNKSAVFQLIIISVGYRYYLYLIVYHI